MLRTFYFSLAIVFAALFTFGGIGGVAYEAYQILNDIPSDASSTLSSAIGWGITATGAVGYVISSYLFVREDDKHDTDADEHDDPSI